MRQAAIPLQQGLWESLAVPLKSARSGAILLCGGTDWWDWGGGHFPRQESSVTVFAAAFMHCQLALDSLPPPPPYSGEDRMSINGLL